MLWRLNDAGEPEAVTARLTKSSTMGQIVVYDIGGTMIVETSDMATMGLVRGQFIDREMPELRKSLGIQNKEDVADKLSRLIRGKTSDDPEEPSKPIAIPYISKPVEVVLEEPKVGKKPKDDRG